MQEVEGWVAGKPRKFMASIIDAKGHLLREDAALSFARMAEAAATDGIVFEINSAFRTHDEQKRLYELFRLKVRKAVAAKPGYSLHESGCAIDIDVIDGYGQPKPALAWLREHAGQFGFIDSVGTEPWHWTFVGGCL